MHFRQVVVGKTGMHLSKKYDANVYFYADYLLLNNKSKIITKPKYLITTLQFAYSHYTA